MLTALLSTEVVNTPQGGMSKPQESLPPFQRPHSGEICDVGITCI